MTIRINTKVNNDTPPGGAPLLPPIAEPTKLSELPPETVKTAELVVESSAPGKSKGTLIGAGTGLVNTGVLSPIDRLNAMRVKEGRHVPFREVFNRASFRGLGINLAGNLLNYGALFGVQPVMADLSSGMFTNPVATKMSTGALSGTAQAMVSRPFSNVSLNIQTAKEQIGAIALMRSIPEGQMLTFLYRGVQATVMRNGSHAMVYFPAYDAIMNLFMADSFDQTHQPNNALKISMGITAGGVAGALGTLVSLPLQNLSVIQVTERVSSLQALKILSARGPTAPWQTLVLTSTRMFAASAVAGGVTQVVDLVYKRHAAKKPQAASSLTSKMVVPVQKAPAQKPGLLSRIASGFASIFSSKSKVSEPAEPNSFVDEAPEEEAVLQAKVTTYFFAPEPGPELLESTTEDAPLPKADPQAVKRAVFWATPDMQMELLADDEAVDSTPSVATSAPEAAGSDDSRDLASEVDKVL